MRKLVALLVALFVFVAVVAAAFTYWAGRPIVGPDGKPIAFTIKPGGVQSSTRQIAQAGVPVNPTLLTLLIRLTGRSAGIKAGSYELAPGTTPRQLIEQLVRGEFAQEGLTVLEGWTFRQMREAIARQPALKHDTAEWPDAKIMTALGSTHESPEGLFFPDTYRFAKGASDMQIYRNAYALMQKRLDEAWAQRAESVPYKTPYEALIMASIVEKETGRKDDRALVAGVFVNRIRRDMPLQTDPTVIYGMGERYHGNIAKRDLLADTPYNTYTRKGLPPTPIALPGAESLAAAMQPADTDALYFVSRGDGSSHFSTSLDEHNRAVNTYILKH
ncbi:MAG: endolytic transglycosylase MltG [Burkholderiaceae bacterium]